MITSDLRKAGCIFATVFYLYAFGSISNATTSYSLGPVPKATRKLPAPDLMLPTKSYFELTAPPKASKMVFAHYMVCCGFGGPYGGVAAAQEDIILAQSMGINGFALNLGAYGTDDSPLSYRVKVANMFQAALELKSNFVLFFSADMTGLTDKDILAMMTDYASHPNYFHYNGKAVLSTFSGEGMHDSVYATPQAWWTNRVLTPLAAAGIPCFFIPGFGNVGAWFDDLEPSYVQSYINNQVSLWTGIADGLHTWQTMSVINNMAGPKVAKPVIAAYQKALQAENKIYMPALFHKYWGFGQPSNGSIYFEWAGGSGMDQLWRSVISNDVPWVEITTWNDPNESYIMPMDDFVLHFSYAGGLPVGFTKPSFGYAELLRYYIAWFRTGSQPKITADAIFWFYRTQTAKAVATETMLTPTFRTSQVTRYVPSADGSGRVPASADRIFVTVLSKASGATLTVNGVNKPTSTGVNQFSVPFVAGPAPTFTLSRGRTKVLSAIGKDKITATPLYYDWWNSSGFVH